MKMNKFRANLHPAFFGIDDEKSPNPQEDLPQKDLSTEKEVYYKSEEYKEYTENIQQSREERKVLEKNIRRNNESKASAESKEKVQDTGKKLEDLLIQLAKNKKYNLDWTNESWKCSRQEKNLALSSTKVFMQLIENPSKRNVEKVLSEFKAFLNNGKLELDEQSAMDIKEIYGINSKIKDIQNFYKSFVEYQRHQSEFVHLQELVGFFFEKGIDSRESLVNEMNQHSSEKIGKKNIKEKGKKYKETGQKDWRERAKFDIIKERLTQQTESVEKMLTLLGDFNLDGEVNSGDLGSKTGSQVADVFRRTVATKYLENTNFDDNTAIKNLVDYANNFGMDIQGVQTVDQLYQWMTDNKKGYENTITLQNFLKNLPIELGDVLTNGKKAGKESLDRISSALNIEASEREAAKRAAIEKTKKFMDKYDSLLKDKIKDATKRANITQQLLSQLPGVLMNEAKNMQEGLGTGVNVPLDELIRGLSLGLNVGIDKDGTPRAGIYGAWDHDFELKKGFDVSAGASAGLNSFFIPCESVFVELGYDVSEKKRKETLDATGINRVSLGANCTMYGCIFSWGVSAGYEHNKQGWIEKQSKNINGQVKSIAEDLLKNQNSDIKENVLNAKLLEKFPKASKEDLKQATNNILQITSQFKIDETTTERDKDIYAQIVADVYTEMWRNEAISGIADNKRKLSGGKVGVQFLAGYFPAVTLVAKFTKNYNARTNETEHSRVARIDAQVNGVGNGKNILDTLNVKEIGSEQVNQINEILKRYGVKSGLSYIAGKDGKPGKIQVPVYIADGIGINVRVAKDLEDKKCVDYIKNEGTNEIILYTFPANATYRLLQETGGNQRSLTLNIGSDKSATSDIMISDVKGMEKLLGNNELISGKKWEYEGDYGELSSIKYEPNFMERLFEKEVVDGLKSIDSDRKKFSEFMRNKTAANGEFDNSVTKLTEILEKTNSVLYKDIIEELKKPHKDNNKIIKDVAVKKQLIIDRIMAISAYTNVHDKNGLELNIGQRGERYKESGNRALKGPNGQSIFDKLSNRDRNEFVNDIKNYEPVFMPDIIGVTAFYHKNNTARGLALTGLGTTYVLGGKTENLTGDDYNEADRWFLGGTNEEGKNVTGALSEKSPQERENIMRCVKKELPEGANLTEENLKDLLKGEEIELTLDKLTLDKPGKKIKVKVDKEYVRYLMGECANESIGMRLKIKIKEQIQKDDYKQGALYLNNGDGSNAVSVSRKDFAAGISFGGKKKKEKEEEKKEPKGDATTNPTETEEDIPKQNSDETSKTGADDNGKVNTGEGTAVGGEGDSDHQGGERPSGNGEGEGNSDHQGGGRPSGNGEGDPTGDEGSTDEWELEPDRN